MKNDIIVRFPQNLSCYREAILKVLEIAPSVGNPRTLVLQFKSLEEAEEKYEEFQNMGIAEGMVTFTKPTKNSDPLSKVVYMGKDKPEAVEFLKSNFGAASAIEMKRNNRGIGLFVIKFNTIEEAEAAVKKTVVFRGNMLKLDNCRSAPKRTAVETTEDAPAKKMKMEDEEGLGEEEEEEAKEEEEEEEEEEAEEFKEVEVEEEDGE